MANVFGGSAVLSALQPTRIIEVRDNRALSWALDLEFSGATGFALVSTGAGQSLVQREYRIESGRIVLPVCADFVTVDVRPEALPIPPAGPGRVVGILSEASASQAPLAPSSANGGYVLLAIATVLDVPQSLGAGRVLYNLTAGPIDVIIGGQTAYVLPAAQSLTLAYCGAFSLLSALGGQVNIFTLHP